MPVTLQGEIEVELYDATRKIKNKPVRPAHIIQILVIK